MIKSNNASAEVDTKSRHQPVTINAPIRPLIDRQLTRTRRLPSASELTRDYSDNNDDQQASLEVHDLRSR
jgi:hypothetical protein